MEIKRAGEVMIPLDEHPHIPYWFTLRQAVAEMEKSEFDINGRKSLPRVLLVFDEKYQLLGIVRHGDILGGLEPEFLASLLLDTRKKLVDVKQDPNLSEPSFDKLIKSIQERAERPVSDVMHPIKATVNYEDHIIKVIYEMVDSNLSLLPVLKDKEVVGVVHNEDLFHEVAKLLLY